MSDNDLTKCRFSKWWKIFHLCGGNSNRWREIGALVIKEIYKLGGNTMKHSMDCHWGWDGL